MKALTRDIRLDDTVWGVPDGVNMLALSRVVAGGGRYVYVARDDARMAAMHNAMKRFCPEATVLLFPAWDCLPFDRVSPHGTLVGQRIDTLCWLGENAVELNDAALDAAVLDDAALDAAAPATAAPDTSALDSATLKDAAPDAAFAENENNDAKGAPAQIVLTTINAITQRVPPAQYFTERSLRVGKNWRKGQKAIVDFLMEQGYQRAQTVREVGEFSIRGGILDVYPPGLARPVRLDFFGDELEGIKAFDPANQRNVGKMDKLVLRPVAEFQLGESGITRFRQGYVAAFGGQAISDSLYESVSAGRMHPGMEHWLPLFHDTMDNLLDFCAGWDIVFDHEVDAAMAARFEQIDEFHAARRESVDEDESLTYRALDADRLYLTRVQAKRLFERAARFMPFPAPKDDPDNDAGGLPGIVLKRDAKPSGTVMAEVGAVVDAESRGAGRRVVLAVASQGAAARLEELVDAHLGKGRSARVSNFDEAEPGLLCIMDWMIETGFRTDGVVVITETDIFGQRLVRPRARRGRGENFLREVSAIDEGDLVVHAEHGIARYERLVTVDSSGGPHDCLLLSYAGGDKLYLPVENIEMLTRYGNATSDTHLDKLGGLGWQTRISRIKGRIRIMADQLIRTAAMRATAKTEPLPLPTGVYGEFCARFGFVETEDQMSAIEDVLSDFADGKTSDRLICGDVGFGKTEVALRAAFIVAMSGYQVAVVAPTTLLARQHGQVFKERFAGFPVKIGVLSRMTSSQGAKQIRADLVSGEVQLVIGTHALLSKSVSFNNLGLLIIDEEQHFGVGQKERLKELRADIHVLALTATPIPRTLQMALSGVRDMSIVATPPVDRLAVRTFVGPWDGVVAREAIKREIFRGGQIFVVCPRIEDLQRVFDRLKVLTPDARILSAHGRMAPGELDTVMTRFADGQADILLSTNIVESGIDIPSANTMIIHRADMFGLSQLYQLRGRVGRGRQRAYAYLTTDPNRLLTDQAKRRLDVMQTLDTLGAGFNLASYDMDIRGAGNLLGDEQSGHVREVGVELYQDMLRQAVDTAKSGGKAGDDSELDWTPQINLGLEVRLPDDYVSDLMVRLSLYRRIADMDADADMDTIIAELVERFGPLPDSVRNLFAVVELKQMCRRANIDRIDAGPKGVSLSFRNDVFDRPEKLIAWIAGKGGHVLLRVDHKLVWQRSLPRAESRPAACKELVGELGALLE